jgi:hypothetical protein
LDKAIEVLKASVALAMAVLLVLYFVKNSGHSYAPGALVPGEPLQSPTVPRSWNKSGFTITALAQYRIEAYVISTERYWLDGGASLSPIDFAVGWGPASDPAILSHLSYSQGHRWFSYRPIGRVPVPLDTIAPHCANMHLIPADDRIERLLRSIRSSDIVNMAGYLVEAARGGQPPWRSSLTRTDTGSGACELMWVEDIARRE